MYQSTSRQHPVEKELAARGPSSALGNIAVSAVLFALFWEHSSTLLGLFTVLALANIYRFFLAKQVSSGKVSSWQSWNTQWNLTVGFVGLIWGLSSSVVALQFGVSHLYTFVVLLCLAGITASAVTGLNARFRLTLFYVLAGLGLPSAAIFSTGPQGTELLIPSVFVIYVGFLLSQGKVQHRKFVEMISQRELLGTIIDNIPLGISLRDYRQQGKFVLVNPKAQHIWNLSENALGKSPQEVFPPEIASEMDSQRKEMMSNPKRIEVTEGLFQLGESQKKIKKIQVYLPEVDSIVEISEDVTHEREVQQQLQDLQASNIHREKMATLGEMAGGIAHEINNPLAIIQAKAGQLKKLIARGEIAPDKLLENLTKIEFTTERIAKIIWGLRAFSRGGDADPFEKISLIKVCSDAIEFSSERFRSSETMLSLDVTEDVEVECRQVQIAQCVLNLLNNSFDAIQALPEKWVQVRLEKSHRGTALIRVIDSGSGIRDPKLIGKIMQPFYTTKEVGKGTGLGLSISKGLIESHGGSLSLNQENSHTEFTIEIPLVQSSRKPDAA